MGLNDIRILVAGIGSLMVMLQAAAPLPSAASSTYTVTKLADTNDGQCDKDCSLREAITLAKPDSIIEFASGLSGTIALKSTLTINKNLVINGPATKPITISGRNAIRVFYVDSDARVKIRNLTIANGSVEGKSGFVGKPGQLMLAGGFFGRGTSGGAGGTAEGAGLYNNGGVVTVENSTFLNNRAKGGAGGKGGLSMSNYFDAGTGGMGGDGLGGGVYNSGILFLINSTFSGNRAIGGTGGDGGAHGGIEENLASGAPDTHGKENNAAKGMIFGAGGPGGNGYGGAIYSTSDAWMVNCTFAANSALAGNGGLGAPPGNGGILTGKDSGSRNGIPGSGLGAAIYRPGALPAGEFAEINRSNRIKIKNSLIVGNEPGGNCEAAIESEGYNISSDGTCHLTATGDRVVPTMVLRPLRYYGGPASTYALPADSPAVNGGNPAGCTDQSGAAILTDQRGQSRTWGGRCDIGAFEFAVEPQK